MANKEEQLKRNIIWLIRDKYAGDSAAFGVKQDMARLKAGEPLDYVIGWKEFLGCKIDLSRKPLIPREETEYWLEEVMKSRIKLGQSSVLDLFAGSGCIGVAILKNFSNSYVTFGEKGAGLLEQIKINCRLNGIKKDCYRMAETDVFSKIKGKYDYIFANPPYVAKNLAQKTQKSVKKWEPAQALWGGQDGLYYIKKFLKEAQKFLKKEGRIFLEFDHQQQKEIEKLLIKLNYRDYQFHHDQFDRWRWAEIGR